MYEPGRLPVSQVHVHMPVAPGPEQRPKTKWFGKGSDDEQAAAERDYYRDARRLARNVDLVIDLYHDTNRKLASRGTDPVIADQVIGLQLGLAEDCRKIIGEHLRESTR